MKGWMKLCAALFCLGMDVILYRQSHLWSVFFLTMAGMWIQDWKPPSE